MSIEILASKLPNVMGTYSHLSHTVLSCIKFLVPAIQRKMFDVGDRETIRGLTFFNVFFQNPKNMTVTFLPRDALVHSAVLRLHVVCLSVCLSVRL